MSDEPSSSSSSSSGGPKTPPNLHQNSVNPDARWIVQKYGGTSVGKFARQIASSIVPSYIDGNKVAIVCSARSGTTKSLGTTNLLLRAAAEALKRPSLKRNQSGYVTPTNGSIFRGANGLSDSMTMTPASAVQESPPRSSSPPSDGAKAPYDETVDTLRNEHIKAARATVKNPAILAELEAEIEGDCDWLRSFLFAAQIINEISPRSKDTIVGLGEALACKIMTALLRDNGLDAEFVPLNDIVPDSDEFDSSGSLSQAFYDRLAVVVGNRIRECAPRIPVVTGFFGPVPGSLLQQVGRGYTDLLSALLAVGLQAAELQIWKEVDGIFTADPRKVPTARLLSVITPEEAAELTYYGSEVVHPFTMEQVIRKKIPIRIKNVENPTGGGTVINPETDVSSTPSSPVTPSMSLAAILEIANTSGPGSPDRAPKKHATAVTIKDNIIVLNVLSNRKNVSHGFLATIFGVLDRYGIVVDLISTSEVYVSMAIEDGMNKKLLDRIVVELQKVGKVSVLRDMAILSLVGRHMRQMVGIAGRMFTTLGQGNINIEMISQGANEINISCVIDAKDGVKALNLIHQNCLSNKSTSESAQGRSAYLHHLTAFRNLRMKIL